MYKQLRNDGFTLVEIIVSIAIGSVVLGLVLSIILTSFNYFGDVSDTGAKKNELDNIIDYVNDQLTYAGKIVISNTAPSGDDWKWIYVKDGMLYSGKSGNDNDRNVLGKEYYNIRNGLTSNRTTVLTMSVSIKKISDNDRKTSDTGYKGIFNYLLKNSYNQSSSKYKQYHRKETLKFSNITGTVDTETYSGDIQYEQNKIADGDSKSIYEKSESDKCYIYYKASSSVVQKKQSPYTGTVADRLTKMTTYLNRGYFTYKPNDKGYMNLYENQASFYNIAQDNYYRVGDYVYYKGYWWQLVKQLPDNGGNAPNDAPNYWERLDENYYEKSCYVKGDVVKYNNKYYRFKDSSNYNWTNPGNDTNSQIWEDVTENQPEIGFDINNYSYSYNNGTKQLYDIDLSTIANSPINDPSRRQLAGISNSSIHYTGVEEYDASNINSFLSKEAAGNFAIGSLVQIKVADSGKSDGSDPYYRLYKKIAEPASFATDTMKIPGNSCFSGWECLASDYYPGSSYPNGAVLRYANSSQKDISNDLPDKKEFIVCNTVHNTLTMNIQYIYVKNSNQIVRKECGESVYDYWQRKNVYSYSIRTLSSLTSSDTLGSTSSAVYAISTMGLWCSQNNENKAGVLKPLIDPKSRQDNIFNKYTKYKIFGLGFGDSWSENDHFYDKMDNYFTSDSGHKEILALKSALIYDCDLNGINSSNTELVNTELVRNCEGTFWNEKSANDLKLIV